jgi:hypothetical protein
VSIITVQPVPVGRAAQARAPGGTVPAGTSLYLPLIAKAPVYGTPTLLRAVDFREFNVGGARNSELSAQIRIFGPNASVAQDLEPEYIAVSPDSRTAYMSLQENNAVAVIDIPSGSVNRLLPLGYKDHNATGAAPPGARRPT